jgi:hypothetical protein
VTGTPASGTPTQSSIASNSGAHPFVGRRAQRHATVSVQHVIAARKDL